MIYIFPKLRVF